MITRISSIQSDQDQFDYLSTKKKKKTNLAKVSVLCTSLFMHKSGAWDTWDLNMAKIPYTSNTQRINNSNFLVKVSNKDTTAIWQKREKYI